MKRLAQVTLAAAIVAMAVTPALAQRPGGGFGRFGRSPLFLLTQKSVQEELKLADEQVAKVKELQEKQRPNRADFEGLNREEIQKKRAERRKAQDEAIAKILKPEQLKRVKQIALQQQGARALANEGVAKALKITDEQKTKIQEIQTKAREEGRGLRGEEGRAKREELRKATNEKVMAVLTDEQKAKLKELQGKPFTGKIESPFGGNRPRRNRN